MFYRGVCPSVINEMTYGELRRWYRLHKLIEKGDVDAAERAKKSMSGG